MSPRDQMFGWLHLFHIPSQMGKYWVFQVGHVFHPLIDQGPLLSRRGDEWFVPKVSVFLTFAVKFIDCFLPVRPIKVNLKKTYLKLIDFGFVLSVTTNEWCPLEYSAFNFGWNALLVWEEFSFNFRTSLFIKHIVFKLLFFVFTKKTYFFHSFQCFLFNLSQFVIEFSL